MENNENKPEHDSKPEGHNHVEEKKEEHPVEHKVEHKKPVVVHHSHHEKKPMGDKLMKNPWMVVSIVLAVIVLVLGINTFTKGMTGAVVGSISQDSASQKVLDFANGQTGGGVTLVEVNEVSGLYEVVVNYQDSDVPLYITKDGENLVQGITPLSSFDKNDTPAPTNTQAQEVPKSDKPKVELFIMTHCPYGTQAEKGFIPMLKEMDDLIDAQIRFVHYFMHDPEETETPIQVCIREEQSDKYLDYLECFLEDGNSSRCLSEVGIDEDALDDCVANDADDYYATDSELSQGYGVSGSPTLVVNGQIVSSSRSPAAYLATVCSAFNEAPSECESLSLATDNPSPGFGYSASGSATTASCG